MLTLAEVLCNHTLTPVTLRHLHIVRKVIISFHNRKQYWASLQSWYGF